MRQLPFTVSASVVLDGSGAGTVQAGPTGPGETWLAGYVASVHASSADNEATCRVYCGPAATPAAFADGTTWGSTGDSTTNTRQVMVGSSVIAVWVGGDPGATAYLTISGTREVP